MKALSVRQPWASLIIWPNFTDPKVRSAQAVAGWFKDVENRDWPTRVRGRIAIHAAKGCTVAEFEDAIDFAETAIRRRIDADIKTIARGGIIGTVEIVDCITESTSPWFMGKYGFLLRDPRPCEFVPYKGQLGFFEVPDELIREAA